VDAAWETLERFGLPDGPVRPVPRGPFDDRAVAEAVARLEVPRLAQRERELLLAWLAAFEHHWPERFRRCLGELGPSLLERLRASEHDPNRFLKLRRISIENLAALL